MEGYSIRIENDGRGTPRWRMTWHDAHGAPRRKWLGRADKMTKHQASIRAGKLYRQYVKDEPPRRGQTYALGQWCDAFLRHKSGLSPATLKVYKVSIKKLLSHLPAGSPLHGIQPHHIAEWKLALEASGSAENTVARDLRHARAIFKLAVRLEVLAKSPCRNETIRAPQTDRGRYVTLDELALILGACPNHAWRCLFAMARLAGLRANECLALTWANVDWNRRLLLVRPTATSTKKSIRDVPIRPELYDLLREAFEHASEGAAGPCSDLPHHRRLYDRTGRHTSVHTILPRSGVLPYGKPIHALRAHAAQDWQGRFPGAVVCQWLGHSATVAAKHYASVTPDQLAQATGSDPRDAEIERLKALLADRQPTPSPLDP